MGIFWLGIKQLLRDWRGGELTLLAAALVLAVASVAGIVLFTDQLQRGLETQSNRFLAADRQIKSPRVVPEGWRDAAEQRGIQWVETAEFITMTFANETFQLASVKAVEPGYPLRGVIRISDTLYGKQSDSRSIPEPGKIWVAGRLLGILGVDIGDRIAIGVKDFEVEKVVVSDPDSGFSMAAAAPRVIMRWDELAATEVIQPGSRLTYRYLLAGETNALLSYEKFVKPELDASQRWISVKQGPASISRALSRSERFMVLGGGLVVVLAGIAIAMAARRYAERHIDSTAVLKSLGVTTRQILIMQIGGLFVIGSLASLLGMFVGITAQAVLLNLLADLIPIESIQLNWHPIVIGLFTGYLCIAVFAMPPIWQMARVSPVAVLRSDQKGSAALARWFLIGSFLVGGLLLGAYSRDWQLTAALLVGLGVVTLVFSTLTWIVIRGLRVGRTYAGSYFHLGLASLRRRGWQSVVQVSVIAQALMLVGVVFVIRTSLIDRWQAQLPEGAPNHFAFNISEQEAPLFKSALRSVGADTRALYPMVRGRLTAINGSAVTQVVSKESIGALNRELNLTWTTQLADDNRIITGQWFSEGDLGKDLVSVEMELAQALGVAIGDRLTFSIAERDIVVTVASLRSVEWDSMHPNFYMIFPPGLLQDFQPTFLTSFYVKPSIKGALNGVLKTYPTVTVLPVDVFIKQIRQITHQAGRTIEVIWLLVFSAGILVLLGTVQSSLDDRYRESALLRAMGGTRQLVLGSLVVEFISMGVLGGVFAVIATEATVFLIEQIMFDGGFQWHLSLWIGLPVLGGIVTGLLGFLSCYRVVHIPPLAILRQSA